MSWARFSVLNLIVVLLIVSAAYADVTINSNGTGDYATIQAGINAVSAGETVWLEEGDYYGSGNKNLDFGGKDITVRAVAREFGGSPYCTINCENDGRGFIFTSGETSAAVVWDIRVRYSSVTGNGGGILIENASPTIINCRFNYGDSSGDGGGMYCGENASPLITGCVFYSNDLAGGNGAGIFCGLNASPVLVNCSISYNDTQTGNGAGIYCGDSSTPVLVNCSFWNNRAVAGYGGGICATDPGTFLDAVNCILWSGVATDGDEIAILNSAGVSIAYSDVDGGSVAVYADPGTTLVWGSGNFDLNPSMSCYSEGCQLNSTSPCIDVGTSDRGTYPLLPDDDVGGDSRIFGTGMDVGCDEYRTQISCEDFLDEFDLSAHFDTFNTGACGHAGNDVIFRIDTNNMPEFGRITATLSNEFDGDFQVSFLDGFDPDSNCLATDTQEVEAVYQDEYLYLVVDGGSGTFDLTITCCAPEGDILIGTTSYCTIQDAIDAALPGETVLLNGYEFRGTGNKNLDFGGKDITVKAGVSDDEEDSVRINCENDGRGFNFHNGETSAAVIQGISVEYGSAVDGAGIYISNASPTIIDCDFSYNDASNYGGGMYCESSASEITGCELSSNDAGSGGGIYSTSSTLSIRNCEFRYNDAIDDGAGFLSISSPSQELINCMFYNNSCTSGAGVHITNCSDPALVNCTFRNNTATTSGGGAYFSNLSTPATAVNCIFWGDTAADGPEIALFSTSGLNISYSDVQGGQSGVYIDPGCTLTWGSGMIDQDPNFDYNYQLNFGSPCIDSGTSDIGTYPDLPHDDIDGDPRSFGAGFDMGCDEFRSILSCGEILDNFDTSTLFDDFSPGACGYAGNDVIFRIDTNYSAENARFTVTLSDEQSADFQVSFMDGFDTDANCLATDTHEVEIAFSGYDKENGGAYLFVVVDGGSGTFDLELTCCAPEGAILVGTTSYCTIQDGIDAAVAGETVWVANGGYRGPGNKNLNFGGKDITVRSVDGGMWDCYIRCENDGRGFIFNSGETSAAVVQGFYIEYGNAEDGAGIYVADASPTIINCYCRDGTASNNGGGIYFENSSSKVTGSQCGDNTAINGGGIYGTASSLTVRKSRIELNDVSGNGGGVYCDGASSLLLVNSYINQNTGLSGGGVYVTDDTELTVVNCTVRSNSVSGYGGGITCMNSTIPATVVNSIFWSNSAPDGPAIALLTDGQPASMNISYSDVQSGQPSVYLDTGSSLTWGSGMMEVDPRLSEYRLNSDSPCIDTGTNDGVTFPDLPDDDYVGHPRPMGLDYDIGCSEYVPYLSCGDFLDNVDTTAGFDSFQGAPCAYPGEDTLYQIRIENYPAVITVELSDEQGTDFYLSILNGPDPATDCLDWDTQSVQTEWNGSDDLYVLVDGGVGTFDLNIVCCPPDNTIFIDTTSYCSIQAAVNAATSGDTIWLGDGTYMGYDNRDIDFNEKALTVRSVSDNPAICIIDCEYGGNGFTIGYDTKAESALRGLTIRNGRGGYKGAAGGIDIMDCSPSITSCVITGCEGNTKEYGDGSGISCINGSPVITNCTISGNETRGKRRRYLL